MTDPAPAPTTFELKTTDAMRRRCRELTRKDGMDDYDRVVAMLLDDFDTLTQERDAWRQECELRTEDYQRAYRREMDNQARAERADAEVARLREALTRIDAIAPPVTDACTAEALRGIVQMMGDFAYAALAGAGEKREGGDDGR
ncbi:MAG: hypothetical protein INF12_14830 [Methylobacterium sp.]|nr:hypothetical protein [Methylobacterium sp.]